MEGQGASLQASEGKLIGPFEEKITLFRVKEREATQVDSLLIDFRLRKIGVVGKGCGQTGRKVVKQVKTTFEILILPRILGNPLGGEIGFEINAFSPVQVRQTG